MGLDHRLAKNHAYGRDIDCNLLFLQGCYTSAEPSSPNDDQGPGMSPSQEHFGVRALRLFAPAIPANLCEFSDMIAAPRPPFFRRFVEAIRIRARGDHRGQFWLSEAKLLYAGRRDCRRGVPLHACGGRPGAHLRRLPETATGNITSGAQLRERLQESAW
jgi:hypothetical protein